MDERKILIHNATIVNEGESYLGYVVVDGEFIAAVGRGEPDQSLFDGAEAIDAKQHLLLPGVIDTHVHFRDPGLTHKAALPLPEASLHSSTCRIQNRPQSLSPHLRRN